MRFFIDDVENTLENRYQTDLELATKKESEKSDFYLEKYIGQKFKININSKEKTYQYLGKEYQNDVVFFYLEITDVEDIDTIEIQNSMLMEEFMEQENYIKINIKNNKKTIVLRKDNDKEMLKF
jgi:tRNA G10  N-methylase Trm11